MIKLILALGAAALPFLILADSKTFVLGSQKRVIEIAPENSTGLNNIFVVYDTSGCKLVSKVSNGYTTVVYRYSNLGGGYAEEVGDVEREMTSVEFSLSMEDMGYIIEDGSSRYYCWVTNYYNHRMTLSSVTASPEQECDYSVLQIEGSASPITYYTINGQPRTLSREIYVDYSTQEFDKDVTDFIDTDVRKIYESIMGSQLSVTPPAYCPSYFTVSGDRFLRDWDMELTAETNLIQPFAVDCRTDAIQDDVSDDGASNIMGGEGSGLGGSAPATINFLSYTTDGVIHNEWQMSRNPEFENPEYRFYQKNLEYTFTEEGSYYLRFIGSNAEGTCETLGDIFTVTIGASALECPNAFSPNGDGINDIWKVSYRSLTDFHCEIFNRNGQKIFGFDNPSEGWDGTWHGRPVKSGVYYYVITATGADGKTYKKSGDINIINSVRFNSPSSSTPEE